MKNELLALLTDRPVEVDWSILDPTHPAVQWTKEYYDNYLSLPTLELFIEECLPEGESAIALAPWSYYVKQEKDVKFVEEASKYLEQFNNDYLNDPKKAILQLRDKFTSITEPDSNICPANISEQLEERWELFRKRKGKGVKTGIEPFDEASGGLNEDDEFLVLSARLGIGKSFMAHYLALNFAKQGLNVGIYSGEMNEHQVGARIDTWLTHISNWNLTRGRLEGGLEEQRAAYDEEVKGKILVITTQHLGDVARPSDLNKFIREHNLTALIVDQLSLMRPDGIQYTDMHQQFSAISTQLRTLQQKTRIPFVIVSQLNRAAEGADPTASNISGSDKIGQDASTVLALEMSSDRKELIVKCLKAREYSVPPKGWSFAWDIDKGVLSHIKTALDAIKAKSSAAKKADAIKLKQSNSDKTDVELEEDFG